MTSYYTEEELQGLGLKAYGKKVLISRYAILHTPSELILGDNVRIDDQCILTGKIHMKSHIHIAAGCYLFGGEGIFFGDFSGLSSRVSIYSASDDYIGDALSVPVVPEEYRNVWKGSVVLHPYALVGASSVLLPGTIMELGAVLGAMGLAKGILLANTIYGGVPAKPLKSRRTTYQQKADAFLCEWTKENQ